MVAGMAARHTPYHLFTVLSHEVRRAVLHELCREPSEEHHLDDLIEHLVEDADGRFPRSELELHCYHTHLPKLADTGLIEYDWEDGTITYDGEVPPDQLIELLEDPGSIGRV